MIKLRRQGRFLLIALAGAVVVADRVAWAAVSQWREDQATVMWLGYTRSPLEVPVGLISSIGLPNPNGLILISSLLSRIASLWIVSTILSIVQGALLVWVCWLATRDRRLFLIAVGPLLSSIILRSTSIELWGQWLLTPLNLLFAGGILLYLRRPSPWMLPGFAVLVLLSSSIYLAGAVNSIIFAMISVVVLATKRSGQRWQGWIAPIIASVGICLLSYWLTWRPYFQEVGFAGIRQASGYSGLSTAERLSAAGETIFGFPLWSLAEYEEQGISRGSAPLQIDDRILSSSTFGGYQSSLRIILAQGLIAYLAVGAAGIALAIRRRRLSSLILPGRRVTGMAVGLMLVFVLLSHVIAPIMGGSVWAHGNRLDETVQFIPFLLMIWFVGPLLLEIPPLLSKAVFTLTCLCSASFTVLSLIVGAAVVAENLRYTGGVLSPADVPLVDKLRAARFVAEDWKSHSSRPQIAVDYDLGGNWTWIPAFGTKYEKWYPAPYTLGRAFDYMLLRVYGLTNVQEGVQLRAFGAGDYLVTYAFNPAPTIKGHSARDLLFGRLRVTQLQDR